MTEIVFEFVWNAGEAVLTFIGVLITIHYVFFVAAWGWMKGQAKFSVENHWNVNVKVKENE